MEEEERKGRSLEEEEYEESQADLDSIPLEEDALAEDYTSKLEDD